jgi:hypothetical protein
VLRAFRHRFVPELAAWGVWLEVALSDRPESDLADQETG